MKLKEIEELVDSSKDKTEEEQIKITNGLTSIECCLYVSLMEKKYKKKVRI